MYKIREEEIVICPYNSHHVVSKLRIQKHMMKCKRNNPEVKLATCFYNYSHRLKPEDLLAHYKICPHKTRLDGARYSEGDSHPPFTPAVRGFPQNNFPDINSKTWFFSDTRSFSCPTRKSYEESQKLETSDSDSEFNNFQLKRNGNITSKTVLPCNDEKDDESKVELNASDLELQEDNSDIDFDDELEPLPLPKTVSKAFVISNQEPNKSPKEMPIRLKPFGRGKTLTAFSPPKESKLTDHLLADLSNMHIKPLKKDKSLKKLFQKRPSGSCSPSAASSIFDDTSTLKSEEIIFDDDFDVNDGSRLF